MHFKKCQANGVSGAKITPPRPYVQEIAVLKPVTCYATNYTFFKKLFSLITLVRSLDLFCYFALWILVIVFWLPKYARLSRVENVDHFTGVLYTFVKVENQLLFPRDNAGPRGTNSFLKLKLRFIFSDNAGPFARYWLYYFTPETSSQPSEGQNMQDYHQQKMFFILLACNSVL